jgi:hypothetical protein
MRFNFSVAHAGTQSAARLCPPQARARAFCSARSAATVKRAGCPVEAIGKSHAERRREKFESQDASKVESDVRTRPGDPELAKPSSLQHRLAGILAEFFKPTSNPISFLLGSFKSPSLGGILHNASNKGPNVVWRLRFWQRHSYLQRSKATEDTGIRARRAALRGHPRAGGSRPRAAKCERQS